MELALALRPNTMKFKAYSQATFALFKRSAYLCSQSLCSPVSMLPGPLFPSLYVSRSYHGWSYVPQYLCSPGSMLPRPLLPSIHVPQYLCFPVHIFPKFHNKRLRDAKSVISAIFTWSSSIHMSIRSRFSR